MDFSELHSAWRHWNAIFFDEELPGPPHFEIEPLPEGWLGAYRARTETIVLPYSFRRRYLERGSLWPDAGNTIIHEMCHAWVDQVAGGEPEMHGGRFKEIADRVGRLLGQPPCPRRDLWLWPRHIKLGRGFRPYPPTTAWFAEIFEWDLSTGYADWGG
ncbi:MAG: SprT-like domain-containing protein [Alphaproteobacteria bacterium]